MRKRKLVAAILLAMTALSIPVAHAEEGGPLFPLPFTPDFTRGSGWGLAIGVGIEYETVYPGSDEYEFELDPVLSVQWRKGNNLNRDFGVSPSETITSGLAETDLDGGYRSAGIRLVDRRYLTDHLQLVSGLEFEYYSSDVRDSPIAREDFAAEVELALVYHF